MPPYDRLARSRGFLRNRIRVGLHRSRNSILPAAQMTVCAVGAYAFAQYVLGHEGPLFAATAALISLGFSREPRTRRVLEVGVGCTLGITVGELLLHVLGTGLWQAAVVLFVSLMLARFLDRGVIFTTQLGLQSLLVVLLPAPDGGVFTRSLDAIVGGLFALVVTMLAPRDPRREPQSNVRDLLHELSAVLRQCAEAVAKSDSTIAWHALVRARNTQPQLDAVARSVRDAREVARISPAYRRHLAELGDLRGSIGYLDLAVRNSRVFARRTTSVINHAALHDEAIERVAEVVNDTADAVDILARALAGGESGGTREKHLRQARNGLALVGAQLNPGALGVTDIQGDALVMLFRPLVVDLLESTGLTHEEAVGYLADV
ncbi:FUSC family protein [Arthrobacter sp. zg-Y820]|uniref:FUSC family protein n=1 Tax=unclassified Arthrobacter TaxID=235627 RepID=UPI001E38ACD0|nr:MULTISPECIES: FUSC family protein [unclassified Arthrobacter]MCC9197472.1 FUSC family protein [Arthrobacter sp. zg-Y820]MDK1280339.1 FUSC family protein [Arthrobacter sp. zg.Y820]MDK1360524.1 FUSC family protein [Arthrobacter sp. zg-Y1219]WIB09624.1 FUSC family protein [Arthrobacter sp. zg-Y820]